MPQKRKPPRLWLRTETSKRTGVVTKSWVIKDGDKHVRTGCAEDQVAEAEQALACYIADKFEPERGGSASKITVADVLIVYSQDKAGETARPKETNAAVLRLNDFFGAMTVSEIKGKACRDFAAERGTQSGARRDLEVLRTALRYYHKEHTLDILPALTLPDKSLPRDRYMTRSEAAALLLATMGWEKDKEGCWTRKKGMKRDHLARLILIGLYTGTRSGAVLKLQWMSSTTGGYVDIDRGIIFRRAEGERVAHNKRKTPVKVARRLQAHLRRWKRLDGWSDDARGHRFVVHYHGAPIIKINKAYRSAISAAGLGAEVVPHILRHTRGTWLAQAGVASNEAAASLGLTVEEYERTYLHNDPDFQKEAADAY